MLLHLGFPCFRYPDIVVGSPFSDATFYFRSRPVVRVDGSIRMETGANGIVDPDFRNCTLTSNGVQVKTITDRNAAHTKGAKILLKSQESNSLRK